MISEELIGSKIYIIRGQKVMLDRDLAKLYGVETKRLKEQVKRNKKRFPEDFMFELTKDEILRSQIATLKHGQHSKHGVIGFTVHGILMLSSVLRSEKAIEVNIQIMRLFSKMRELLINHKELIIKLQHIENHLSEHDDSISIIMQYLKQFKQDQEIPRKEIGFKQ